MDGNIHFPEKKTITNNTIIKLTHTRNVATRFTAITRLCAKHRTFHSNNNNNNKKIPRNTEPSNAAARRSVRVNFKKPSTKFQLIINIFVKQRFDKNSTPYIAYRYASNSAEFNRL